MRQNEEHTTDADREAWHAERTEQGWSIRDENRFLVASIDTARHADRAKDARLLAAAPELLRIAERIAETQDGRPEIAADACAILSAISEGCDLCGEEHQLRTCEEWREEVADAQREGRPAEGSAEDKAARAEIDEDNRRVAERRAAAKTAELRAKLLAIGVDPAGLDRVEALVMSAADARAIADGNAATIAAAAKVSADGLRQRDAERAGELRGARAALLALGVVPAAVDKAAALAVSAIDDDDDDSPEIDADGTTRRQAIAREAARRAATGSPACQDCGNAWDPRHVAAKCCPDFAAREAAHATDAREFAAHEAADLAEDADLCARSGDHARRLEAARDLAGDDTDPAELAELAASIGDVEHVKELAELRAAHARELARLGTEHAAELADHKAAAEASAALVETLHNLTADSLDAGDVRAARGFAAAALSKVTSGTMQEQLEDVAAELAAEREMDEVNGLKTCDFTKAADAFNAEAARLGRLYALAADVFERETVDDDIFAAACDLDTDDIARRPAAASRRLRESWAERDRLFNTFRELLNEADDEDRARMLRELAAYAVVDHVLANASPAAAVVAPKSEGGRS